MSYPGDLYPSGPGPEYTAPLRQLILDGLALLITDHLLDTADCPACRVNALTCRRTGTTRRSPRTATPPTST